MPRSSLFGSVINAQEYLSLAAAADYHSDKAPSPQHQAAKLYVELDRLARMTEETAMRYRVRMGKLPKSARSPKDDVLWGWSAANCNEARDVYLRGLWKHGEVSEALIRGGFCLHEGVDESAIPAEVALLSPAADHDSMQMAMQLIQRVAFCRDDVSHTDTGCVPVTSVSLATATSAGSTQVPEIGLSEKETRRRKFDRAVADKALRMKKQPHQTPEQYIESTRAVTCGGYTQQSTGFVARDSPAGRWCLHPSCLFQTHQECNIHQWSDIATLEQHAAPAHCANPPKSDRQKRRHGRYSQHLGIPNSRGYKRLMQETAHALCVSCFTSARTLPVDRNKPNSQQMYVAPPPHWPFILDRSLQLAGPALEQAVARYAALIPVARRKSLSARQCQLGHRMVLVTEAELRQLWSQSSTEATRRQLLDDVVAALGRAVCELQIVGPAAGETACVKQEVCTVQTLHLGGEMVVTAHPQLAEVEPDVLGADPDLDVSGVVRKCKPAVVFSVAFRWPQATAWRRKVGLSSTPNGDGTFVVVLGM